ncbi:MAG: molybdopterin cofactor-binding domain-containing protein [Gammaproteobacteria bacterium]|jgi:isoquinoline 1-oxidoreductase beta subunit
MNMNTDQLLTPELPDFFRDLLAAKEAAAEQALEVNRRGFLKLSGVAGGGLIIGLAMTGSNKAMAQAKKGAAPAEVTLSPYVQIKPNGRINVFSKNPECGQGIKTGLPLIIAEELDCAWKDVDVMQADIDPKRYGAQFAGGSTSTPTNWMPMRIAGATARAMILAAAAKKMKLPLDELTTSEGKVLHAKTSKSWGYGDFAELAATMPVPDPKSLVLKDQKDFKILGKRHTGVDNVGIVTGKPLFGADTQMQGMVYATYSKCPQTGGKAVSFNEAHIKSLPGVIDAFIVEPFGDGRMFPTGTGAHFGGVAIVGQNTWAAIKAKRELEVQWDTSTAETATWSELVAQAEALKDKDGEQLMVNAGPPGPNAKRVAADRGDVAAAFAGAAKTLTGFYEYPYVSHAQLEPQTTTALFKDGRLDLWAPSQIPGGGESGGALRVGLAPGQSTLHQLRIGGGFGRKLANDYAFEAAAIAQKMEGRPVKLQWTREDDMMHDYYRPGGFHSYKAALDADGKLIAFQDHFMTHSANGTAPMTSADLSPAVFPMDVVPNLKLTQTLFKNGMPTGAMRAPSSNAFAFSFQSFMHELALASGKPHADFLMESMNGDGFTNQERQAGMNRTRAKNVIKAVVERSGYGKQMPAGQGQGLSFYFCHNGYVAQVADVTVSANKEVKVNKVWAVADFGFIHNRSGAENQLEGGIVDGLSQLFNAKITFNKGVVQQQNFHQYPLLRMPQTPALDTLFLEPTEYSPTGGGEPSMPPLLAAVSNAIFNATGQRVRKMPLSESGYRLV